MRSRGRNSRIIDQILYCEKQRQPVQYPEGWDRNMKRSVRKRADRVIMKGVEVMYKKKNSDEVRMIQSREEQIRTGLGGEAFSSNILALRNKEDL